MIERQGKAARIEQYRNIAEHLLELAEMLESDDRWRLGHQSDSVSGITFLNDMDDIRAFHVREFRPKWNRIQVILDTGDEWKYKDD